LRYEIFTIQNEIIAHEGKKTYCLVNPFEIPSVRKIAPRYIKDFVLNFARARGTRLLASINSTRFQRKVAPQEETHGEVEYVSYAM